MIWYVAIPGKCWQLCEIVSNVLGKCQVRLYDGSIVSGTLRREKYGVFVDAR